MFAMWTIAVAVRRFSAVASLALAIPVARERVPELAVALLLVSAFLGLRHHRSKNTR